MPSIRTMKIFLAVVRHGTFAAAGKQIGLTPAAVGLQMRALENDLRCVLFDRSARAAVLNASGRRLVPELEELVQRYELLVTGQESGGLSGRVVMGALVSALMGDFADALWAIKHQNPQLDVHLFSGMSADFALMVERGDIDAAVVTQSPGALARGLVWTELYTEPMILIVPRHPHFSLSPHFASVLRDAPFMRFERGTWTGMLVQEVLDVCGIKVNESMELNSNEAIMELVRQGFGVSIVPQVANVDWDRDRFLRVMPMAGVDVRRRVGLLERTVHSRMAFTEAIKDYFRQSGPKSARASAPRTRVMRSRRAG
jgi:DNA-binding transcriptional LysR family regulator